MSRKEKPMTYHLKKLFFIPALVLSTQAFAAEPESTTSEQASPSNNISIEWVKPEKFRDVKHPSISRKRYRESVFAELETFFASLATALPDGQTVNIKVTNLDLAGTVQTPSMAGLTTHSNNSTFGMNDYRIIRDIDIPRMHLSYELLNEKGELIQQQDVKLKDMSFLMKSNSVRKNTPLRYEKEMISEWFKSEFLSQA